MFQAFADTTVLFEPLGEGLPSGFLASPALIKVIHGTVYVPVVNVGTLDVLLYPRSILGSLNSVLVVSLPTEVVEVQSVAATGVQGSQVLSASGQGSQVSAVLDYHAVFSAHEGDLGCTNLIIHEILLVDNIHVRQRYQRKPPSEYEVVKTHINQLLEAQVIRESSSPYASSIVLVKKKDGSLRMCVDFRQLNSKTRKDAFPLPRIEESLDSLTGARWFSTMDLASGYNQVSMAMRD